VLSDSATAFWGAARTTCSYGGAFRILRYLTYWTNKFLSSWDPSRGLQETSSTAETFCAALWETLNLVRYSHSCGSKGSITTSYFIYSIHFYYNHIICYIIIWHVWLIYVFQYIDIQSICSQTVLECKQRSSGRKQMRALRDALGGCDWPSVEMHLQMVIKRVWRQRSSELRDALEGHYHVNLEIQLEAMIMQI